MGLMDAINKEDRVEVRYSDFYNFMKGCTQREQLMNAVNCEVPYRYIREMMTGKSEEPQVAVDDTKLIGGTETEAAQTTKKGGKNHAR